MKLLFSIFGLLVVCAFEQTTPQKFTFTDTTFKVGSVLTRRTFFYTDDCRKTIKTGTKTLDSLALLLKNYPALKIEIGSYQGRPCKTCNNCQPTTNAANAIKQYLVKKGVDEKRLIAIGYGLTTPVIEYSGNDKKQKLNAEKLNDRIEFKITYNTY